MTEHKMKRPPHIHAEAIKAWADGKAIEWRSWGDPNWSLLGSGNPSWSIGNEYRVKPEEVVDYTVIFSSGTPGANFQTTEEEVWEYYRNTKDKQGFMKRTTIDGKVASLEFIPKDDK